MAEERREESRASWKVELERSFGIAEQREGQEQPTRALKLSRSSLSFSPNSNLNSKRTWTEPVRSYYFYYFIRFASSFHSANSSSVRLPASSWSSLSLREINKPNVAPSTNSNSASFHNKHWRLEERENSNGPIEKPIQLLLLPLLLLKLARLQFAKFTVASPSRHPPFSGSLEFPPTRQTRQTRQPALMSDKNILLPSNIHSKKLTCSTQSLSWAKC